MLLFVESMQHNLRGQLGQLVQKVVWPITWSRLTVACFAVQIVAHYWILFAYFADASSIPSTTQEIFYVVTYGANVLLIFAYYLLTCFGFGVRLPPDPDMSSNPYHFWTQTIWRLMSKPADWWHGANIQKERYLHLRLCATLHNYFTLVAFWLIPHLVWLVIADRPALASRGAIVVCVAGACILFALWSHRPVDSPAYKYCRRRPYQCALDNWLALLDALQTAGSSIVWLLVLLLPQPAQGLGVLPRLSLLYVGIVIPLGWVLELALLPVAEEPVRLVLVEDDDDGSSQRSCSKRLRKWVMAGCQSTFFSLPLSLVSRSSTLKRVYEAPVPRLANDSLRVLLLWWVKSHPLVDVSHERMHACERAMRHFSFELIRDWFTKVPCTTATSFMETELVRDVNLDATSAEKRYLECIARVSPPQKRQACQCYDAERATPVTAVVTKRRKLLQGLAVFLALAHHAYWWFAMVSILARWFPSNDFGPDELLRGFLLFLVAATIAVYVVLLCVYRQYLLEWCEQQRLWCVFGESVQGILRLVSITYRCPISELQLSFITGLPSEVCLANRLQSQPEVLLSKEWEMHLLDTVERLYSQQISSALEQEVPTHLPALYADLLVLIGDYLLIPDITASAAENGAESADWTTATTQEIRQRLGAIESTTPVRSYDIAEPSVV